MQLNTIAIVQARMGSNRLPGKSLKSIMGKPILELLLQRLNHCTELDAVIVATSAETQDDAIAGLARYLDIRCVRGSESDVLGRFIQASNENPSLAVVRICADNPLTDPMLVDSLVRHFQNRDSDYAYSNRKECGFPDGVGSEIISTNILHQIAVHAKSSHHREHVTSYIHDNPNQFQISAMKAPTHLCRPDIRLDVDYGADLKFLAKLCRLLPKESAPLWDTKQVIDILDEQPQLLKLRFPR